MATASAATPAATAAVAASGRTTAAAAAAKTKWASPIGEAFLPFAGDAGTALMRKY